MRHNRVAQQRHIPRIHLHRYSLCRNHIRMRLRTVFLVQWNQWNPPFQFLREQIIFILAETPDIPPVGSISYQRIAFDTQYRQHRQHQVLRRYRIGIQRLGIRAQHLSAYIIQIRVQHQRIARRTDATADKQFTPLDSCLRILRVRVVEQDDIPFPCTGSRQPVIAEERTERQTQPVTPLADQNPFPLVKRILHAGGRNHTSRHKQCPHQPDGQHRHASCLQPSPPGLSFVHTLI